MIARKVSIVDYGMGNIWSIVSALKYLGVVDVRLISNPDDIMQSDFLILPGVGSFRKGMESLINSGIDKAIIDFSTKKKGNILGICLGMHLMGSYGAEDGGTKGLGLLPNKVELFTPENLNGNKLPHVGFNSTYISEDSGIFNNLDSESDFYYTHSYRMLADDIQGRYAICKYGIEFLAAFEMDNICGTQFHPEKSQKNGLILLNNFVNKVI